MSSAATAAAQHQRLQLQPAHLQKAAVDLTAVADTDPRNVEAREAAAQAYQRLVVIGAAKDRERKFLDRAIELDPYSAQAHLLAALSRHRSGELSEALAHYDHACWLAPNDSEVRYHRGYALLEAARRPDLGEDEASQFAEAAGADFEVVLKKTPNHPPAAFGAIEAAVQGKATKLRDSLKGLFARVTPHEALARTAAVLLYQVIFAFRVGKAKGVDQKNQKTMADVEEIARKWLEACPGDAELTGVIWAAKAKCEAPEGLCEKITEYAKGIPDVRILRLLLRERLAEVLDVRRRLELFESAMKKIPALDGIAHDYLQLKHLAGKRAAAEGDFAAARSTWQECEQLDPDNPSVVVNLLHLASGRGDAPEVARLTAKLEDLWSIYAQVSPRADLVLMRAHARHEAFVLAELDRYEQSIKEEKRPSVAEINALVDRWVVGQALARLAVDDAAREELTPAALRAILSFGALPAETLDVARQVMDLPVTVDLPTVYAYLDLAKDAPNEEIHKGLEALREKIDKTMEEIVAEDGDPAPFRALLNRAKEQTRVLLDPLTRAAYDHKTAPVDLAEVCRRQCVTWRRLVRMAVLVQETDVPSRTRMANNIAAIPRRMLEPYLPTSMQDDKWFEVMLLRVRFIGLIRQGWELAGKGEISQALQLCSTALGEAGNMFAAHELFVLLLMRDTSRPLWEGVDVVQRNAQRALEVAHWSDSTEDIKNIGQLANCPPEYLAQRMAAGRALTLLDKNMRQAIDGLWQAYPRHRGVPYPGGFGAPVMPLSKLSPAGRAFYAFVVARVIRSGCIDWYNNQYPTSQYQLMMMKQSAREMGAAAHQWAVFAMNNLTKETLPPQMLRDIFEGINDLMSALQRDGNTLR